MTVANTGGFTPLTSPSSLSPPPSLYPNSSDFGKVLHHWTLRLLLNLLSTPGVWIYLDKWPLKQQINISLKTARALAHGTD